jgi:hypothetical protein
MKYLLKISSKYTKTCATFGPRARAHTHTHTQTHTRTTARQVNTDCQTLLIKSVLYGELNKVENLLVNFNSFV